MVERLTDGLWRPWLLGAFLLVGLWCSVRSGFFQIFGVKTWWNGSVGALKKERGGGKGLSQMQTLATALASTIGTGAVAGVATALFFGGPGAVFWMWVSALLGMMTSFAEKALAVKYRVRTAEGWEGGPMEYMRGRLGWRLGAAWFALWCAMAALTGGALVQANSIAHTLQAAFGWGRLTVGLGIALCVGAVLLGGVRGIGRVSEAVVPVMAAIFLAGGLIVLIIRIKYLPATFGMIFQYAFQPQAIIGGGFGYAIKTAISQGAKRGLFSNEAGMGSTPHAHAQANVTDPHDQGVVAMIGVFMDTFVVLTLNALVVISTLYTPGGPLYECGAAAASTTITKTNLAQTAFGVVFGESAGNMFVAVCLFFFAFSTILSWNMFGKINMMYLFGKNSAVIYTVIGLVFVFLGTLMSNDLVWELSDMFNNLMVIPNALALFALTSMVLKSTHGVGIRK